VFAVGDVRRGSTKLTALIPLRLTPFVGRGRRTCSRERLKATAQTPPNGVSVPNPECESAERGIDWSGGPHRDARIVEEQAGIVVGQHAGEVKRGRGIRKTPTRVLVLKADVALLEALDAKIF
jgi:hypothetical protein